MRKLYAGFILGLCLMMGTALFAQRGGHPGIKLSGSDTKTVTYRIRINENISEADAHFLDTRMLEKESIVSSSTDASSRICTVRVLKDLEVEMLVHVVEFSGLSVAKSFDP